MDAVVTMHLNHVSMHLLRYDSFRIIRDSRTLHNVYARCKTTITRYVTLSLETRAVNPPSTMRLNVFSLLLA